MENREMKKHILSQINDDNIFNSIAEEAFNSIDTDKNLYIDKNEFKICSLQIAKGFVLEIKNNLQ